MSALTTLELERLLFEDAPYGDLTTEALGIGDVKARIRFAARGPMIVSAIEETATLLALVGGNVRVLERSGTSVRAGQPILEGEGPAAGVLKAWKVAQTLVEIWSGVATAANAILVAAREVRPEIVVACTRKNAPGTKALAIAAIKAAGSVPHRLGLSETILVFPEHRAFLPDAGISALARELRSRAPEKKLVIEVNSVAEAIEAADAGFDVIQAEKFEPDAIAEVASAFAALSARPVLAAAGGVHPGNARAYAAAGADVLVTSWPYTAGPADVAVTISGV